MMPNCGELPWLLCGDGFPSVYHGGKRKVREVDPQMLQKRDSGFYGKGFYVTTARHYARTYYGHIISEYRFTPDAKILDATLRPQDAPPGLVKAVVEHVDRKYRDAVVARGKEMDFEADLLRITEEPFEWRNALIEYGMDLDVDAIAFSRGEIVVRKPGTLIFLR